MKKTVLILLTTLLASFGGSIQSGGGVTPEQNPPRPPSCNAVDRGDPDLGYCTVLEFLPDGVCIFSCKGGIIIR